MRNFFELMYSIRMLLDDSRDWYFEHILYALNEAQYKLIGQQYALHNELFLRPLYRYDYDLASGDVIQETDYITKLRSGGDGILYPRIAQIYFVYDGSTVPINDYKIPCEYVEPTQFLVRSQQSPIYTISTPVFNYAFRDVVYTIIDDIVQFDTPHPNIRLEIFYIKKPKTISVTIVNNNITSYTPPEIEELYIPQLVGMTAEILNTKDVLEMQRGDVFNVYAGDTKLTLQGIMEIIGGKNG